jgi:hypothetical protein
MSRGDGTGRARSRSRSPLRDPDAKIRLARIFISHDGVEYEWDGIAPEPGDTLFIYGVTISDQTYRSNITLCHTIKRKLEIIINHETHGSERYPIESRAFTQMRGSKNGVIFSYLHNADNKRTVSPYSGSFFGNKEMHQVEFLPTLMSRGKIFQNNKDFSCWYDLNGPDYPDDKTFLIYIDVEELNKNYTPLHSYVPKKIDKNLLMREPGASLNTPSRTGGGGKTRRKFKVKKRRNRRRRNTMKRRKTAVKRRNR